MIVELGVEHTPSPWVWLANKLGVKIHWTHAFLRHNYGGEYKVIEAVWQGVVERAWRPETYHSYAIYRLKDECFVNEGHKARTYFRMRSFAMGNLEKRYRFEALPVIVRRLLSPTLGLFWQGPPRTTFTGFSDFIIGTGEVCTSLVDKTFLWGGFDLLPGETSPFVLPDELAGSELLEKVEVRGDKYTFSLL